MIRKTKEEVLAALVDTFNVLGRIPTRSEYEAIVDPTIPFWEVRQTLGSWNKVIAAVEAYEPQAAEDSTEEVVKLAAQAAMLAALNKLKEQKDEQHSNSQDNG